MAKVKKDKSKWEKMTWDELEKEGLIPEIQGEKFFKEKFEQQFKRFMGQLEKKRVQDMPVIFGPMFPPNGKSKILISL